MKYDIEANFKRALTAVIMDDYNTEMTVEQVIENAGWCADDPKSMAKLLKK